MAINEVLFPTVPNPVIGDWALAIELVEHAYKNIYNPVQFSGSNVVVGAVFQVGGHVYHTDGATAITGTSSDYVKLTVTGTTLVPSFVADLTGVTWNSLWGGYYDGTGNLYIFDEVKAILAGDLVGGSKFAELFNDFANQGVKTTDDVAFNKVSAGKVNTGNGDVECYAMNQDLETTDAVEFATVNTGNGATEIYDMNQDLRSDDSVSFVNITASGLVKYKKYYTATGVTYKAIYDTLKVWLPSIGDFMSCEGKIKDNSGVVGSIQGIYHTDATYIDIFFINSSGVNDTQRTLDSATQSITIEIMSNFNLIT